MLIFFSAETRGLPSTETCEAMKVISAHVTGFYRSSFHAYTTEVNVDGHRWRLGLRYSKFHEFYGELVAKDSDFHAEFPPKGTLFFTPKPEERQEQLDVFLQQVLAYYAAKDHPTEIESLLCDLLKVPRHLKSPEHEDDDVSTSTESVLDDPMHEPPSSSDSTVSVEKLSRKEEEKFQVADINLNAQVPVQETMPESPVATKEEKAVASPEPVQPVSPVAEERHSKEETGVPSARDEVKVAVVAPTSAEETDTEKEVVEKGYAAAEEVTVREVEATPIAPEISAEEQTILATKAEKAAEEQHVIVPENQAADDVAETHPEKVFPDELPVAEPIVKESALMTPRDVEQPAPRESHSLKDNVEQKELAASGRVSTWIAAYLPKSLLGFLRHRCMKTTNLVMLCVALLLPMVLARK